MVGLMSTKKTYQCIVLIENAIFKISELVHVKATLIMKALLTVRHSAGVLLHLQLNLLKRKTDRRVCNIVYRLRSGLINGVFLKLAQNQSCNTSS